MRKVLLATTALIGVAFAGAAHAAAPASPISLNVGGYDDFVAGYQSGGGNTAAGNKNVHDDFENEFKISFDALGKASNGVEYGANIALWNGAEANEAIPWQGGGNGVTVNSAYVWLSGAFGKALFGDEHGASDLFVYAPTVGEGQIDGRYHDFTNASHIAFFMPSGFDNTEHSTKVTYYTPKVGNDISKVQLGISYAPQLYDYGQNIIKSAGVTTGGTNGVSPDQDIIKGVAQYTGNFKPVNVTASAEWIHGGASHTPLASTTFGQGLGTNGEGLGLTSDTKDFNSWGLGAQAAFNGVTLGGGYTSLGDYNTIAGQNKDQSSFNLGAKYEFDKVGVAASWIDGRGYDNILGTSTDAAVGGNTNYVKSFNAYGAGATYTWFPGLTSNVDGVMYNQKVEDETGKQGGYTLLVSQRLAF